ncbi:S8 family serine peptidase [bacterium]|nr:S8 family serine peptidase [bacterium]
MSSGKVSTRTRRVAAEASIHGQQIPIIVKFHSGHSMADFHGHSPQLTAQSMRKGYSLIPAIAMSVKLDELDELAEMDEVAEVWYDEKVYAVLDSSMSSINVQQVWTELGVEGEGVSICVLDTGIDINHPDFTGRLRFVEDFTGVGSVIDAYGHGTHISSIAAGSGAVSDGLYRGVAPKALIMAAKVLDDRGNGRMSDVMAGVEWALDKGADVFVLSLSTEDSSDGSDALCTILNAVVEEGKIVVVAAGNGGPVAYTIGSPGAADRVITVGATIDGGDIADYSGRGPTADGRTKPEIVAPGSNVTAALASGSAFGAPINDFYTIVTGSSMAAPHVAGICALIWSANRSLLPDDVKWILMDTAVDLGKPANAQGTGRVDALAAVRAALAVSTSVGPESTIPDPIPTPASEVLPADGSLSTGSASAANNTKATPGCLGALINLLGVRW